ncbi:DUF5058 family protein [Saxibacter everestensis]|uniref:DUF5058 family protein n=1 Tax=Saxibacter everestensis TaxID=2909229 RepID=A0ABY8QUW1_9MICO|nr:DUF5058 family protein [Brevibacteriaceae bacterium ZFBP1038]
MTSLSAQQGSADVSAIANTPFLWFIALAVFAVIAGQSVIYLRAAKKAAPDAGMTPEQMRTSFRSGAVAAIGPSLSIVLVAVALLPLFGTPPVLVRIGVIGSAATEVASATLAAGTQGAELGGEGYTSKVFVIAFFAMGLSGAMWMLATLILTPLLKRGDSKLRRVNPQVMAIVPAAALLAAFASLTVGELAKTPVHIITVIASAIAMSILLFVAKKLGQPWLNEWALGFSIVIGLVVAYFAHAAGLGA